MFKNWYLLVPRGKSYQSLFRANTVLQNMTLKSTSVLNYSHMGNGQNPVVDSWAVLLLPCKSFNRTVVVHNCPFSFVQSQLHHSLLQVSLSFIRCTDGAPFNTNLGQESIWHVVPPTHTHKPSHRHFFTAHPYVQHTEVSKLFNSPEAPIGHPDLQAIYVSLVPHPYPCI